MDEIFFIYNGDVFLKGTPVIHADNRGLRYGDGLFETLRLFNGKILNAGFHFERFFSGMKTLQFTIPSFFNADFFTQKINELLKINRQEENAKIRLMAFREGGNIFDTNSAPGYIIETFPLPAAIELNEDGLIVDIFEDSKKGCDVFSNLKSSSYTGSVMAGIFAVQNKLDDAIILNAYGRVCETSIANIFIIKGKNIFTPPLSEGCVAGTIRRFMLQKFSLNDYKVIEKNVLIEDLLEADEVFITNAIKLISWVKILKNKVYSNNQVQQIFDEVKENLIV